MSAYSTTTATAPKHSSSNLLPSCRASILASRTAAGADQPPTDASTSSTTRAPLNINSSTPWAVDFAIASVNMTGSSDALLRALPMVSTAAVPAGTNTRPGLVQNWPDPRVKEPTNPSAISSIRVAAAALVTTTGLTVDISAYVGMTVRPSFARRPSARPAACDPVNARAATPSSRTRATPASQPTTMAKLPLGAPA